MPYCNPKANGEAQKLNLNTTKPRPAAGMFVKDEPIVESPKAMDFEEGTLEGPPQVNLAGVVQPKCQAPCQDACCKHCGREA